MHHPINQLHAFFNYTILKSNFYMHLLYGTQVYTNYLYFNRQFKEPNIEIYKLIKTKE